MLNLQGDPTTSDSELPYHWAAAVMRLSCCPPGPSTLQEETSRILRAFCGAVIVNWYHLPWSAEHDSTSVESLCCPTTGLPDKYREAMKQAAICAVRTGYRKTLPLANNSNLTIVAMPLKSPESSCIVAVLEDYNKFLNGNIGEQGLKQLVDAVEGCSREALKIQSHGALKIQSHGAPNSLVTGASGNRTQGKKHLSSDVTAAPSETLEQAADEAHQLAALIEILSRVQGEANTEDACERLAELLREHFQAAGVFVSLTKRGTRLAELKGSSLKDATLSSDNLRRVTVSELVAGALQEAISKDSISQWPNEDPVARVAMRSHQELADQYEQGIVISSPISTLDGTLVAAIAVILLPEGRTRDQHLQQVHATRCFINAASQPIASCLEIIQRLADSRILNTIRWCRKQFTVRRVRTIISAVATTSLLLLIPFPYRIDAHCELQPVERRYVASPFAGSLEECYVEPGDLVDVDQLLARMDGREVRWELAGVNADLHKATKERNTHLNTHQFGSAEIARHEVERLQNRTELLETRNAELEIRTPIAGIVVSGDHHEKEGVALEVGQSLFEIAPLEVMNIEVGVPEDDIRHVRQGMVVQLQLNAFPETIFEAEILRIHPRAELRDQENVFVCDAELENTSLILRPGMRGTGKVIADRRSLGWILFHKPVAYFTAWMGW
ncbi:MAG: efflux RND transporter periplasmic adaptor subunit [Planctomyces sp.]|nr:efflux RND transporter periplasmic adaptor subunit [Planctomyces sp.]